MDNTTPVLGNGTNNLDNGIVGDQDQINAFDGFLNGANHDEDVIEENEELEEIEEEVEDVVEDDEEEELIEEDIEEEEDSEVSDEETSDEYYVVEIEGESYEVTEQELLSGYQRHKDYTRKTSEVSEERKEVKALQEQLNTERDGYITQMEELAKAESDTITARYANVNWAELRKEDPTQYMLLREDLQADKERVQSHVDKRKLAVDARAREIDEQHNKHLEAESKRVEELIPDFTDELRGKLNTQVEAEGFTEEDKKLLSNAQVIKLLDKARRYDELQERRETVVKKKAAKSVPKLIKPGSASEQTQGKTNAKKRYEASKRKFYANTSDRQAAADVFSQFL
jgi:hypothetical protein